MLILSEILLLGIFRLMAALREIDILPINSTVGRQITSLCLSSYNQMLEMVSKLLFVTLMTVS